ncbi:MAG: hypothetical protein A2X49_16510 [Lentisphaerae bacterium GWF2_52_8]|nr:MAG: hypothetical protein A2X49_16510 [Lentisphaerae bacterium GWF2_52_8]
MPPKMSIGIAFLNLFFYGRLILISFLYCFSIGLYRIAQLPFTPRKEWPLVWRRAIMGYGRTAIRFSSWPFVRIHFADLEPERNEPGVVVANHRSGSDGYFFGLLSQVGVQVVNDWPFHLPFYGFFARRAGYFDIVNMKWDEFLSKTVSTINDEACSVVGFPEGTRSARKELLQFHGALFRVAMAAGCPVYPMIIIGTQDMPDRNFVMHPGTISIYKLPAVMPEVYKNWTAHKLKTHVRKIMAEEIEKRDP